MKQTARIISTYAADVSGVCSALYELGGMTVMHDASGCNSTYNTHDEPRWYDMDSMVYISGLSEIEAIMGDDQKLIDDIVDAAMQTSPNFIAIAGTPIPMMIGTDFPAIASVVERTTGIPSFGFATNGMHSYLSGISMAYQALAERFVDKKNCQTNSLVGNKNTGKDTLSVNILGTTPLDFSVNGSVDSMKQLLQDNGFTIISTWAMGSSLDEIREAGKAGVNLVVSYSGLAAAKKLQEIFGTPYVVGTPYGKVFSEKLINELKSAVQTSESKVAYTARTWSEAPDVTLIGESVLSGSLAAAIHAETGKSVQVLCPLETEPQLLCKGDCTAANEDDLIPYLKNSRIIIADPLYQPICPDNSRFIPLPHEAFSGRIFRKDIPDLVADFAIFLEKLR